MYRSLHTAVLSKRSGRPMEIQIRTREMHEVAERGIAAHWQYKEQRRHDARFQEKIAWLRQLMEWRQDVTDAAEFVDGMKTDVFHDRVYVFTPQGDVIDLPAGSTPIDFAYAIHTELGHRCRGANIKGRLVPLDYKLQNGDQVTIIAAKRGGPSRDWLNPNLEYVATQRARSKIRNWLRKQGRDENIHARPPDAGKGDEAARHHRQLRGHRQTLQLSTRWTTSWPPSAMATSTRSILPPVCWTPSGASKSGARWHERPWEASLSPSRQVDTSGGFSVQGVDGLLTHLGRCCNPVPGDPIVGYVTRGKGLTVHRTNCPNVANIVRKGQDIRLVDVQWAAVAGGHLPRQDLRSAPMIAPA